MTASSLCWLRSLQQQRNCMLTRTAALMSRSFCKLTQVLICMCRLRMKRPGLAEAEAHQRSRAGEHAIPLLLEAAQPARAGRRY